MEQSNCLMLMASLYLGIDLNYIFDEEDLRDDGIEYDSHITVFYETGKKEYIDLKEHIKDSLGPSDFEVLMDYLKKDYPVPILDVFELSQFNGKEGPILILKLKKSNHIYKYLEKINKELTVKYNIKSDFDEYIPHLTLAYLKPGHIEKYTSGKLDLILQKGLVRFDDFLMSYGYVGEKDNVFNAITNFHTLERHFRLDDLKR